MPSLQMKLSQVLLLPALKKKYAKIQSIDRNAKSSDAEGELPVPPFAEHVDQELETKALSLEDSFRFDCSGDDNAMDYLGNSTYKLHQDHNTSFATTVPTEASNSFNSSISTIGSNWGHNSSSGIPPATPLSCKSKSRCEQDISSKSNQKFSCSPSPSLSKQSGGGGTAARRRMSFARRLEILQQSPRLLQLPALGSANMNNPEMQGSQAAAPPLSTLSPTKVRCRLVPKRNKDANNSIASEPSSVQGSSSNNSLRDSKQTRTPKKQHKKKLSASLGRFLEENSESGSVNSGSKKLKDPFESDMLSCANKSFATSKSFASSTKECLDDYDRLMQEMGEYTETGWE